MHPQQQHVSMRVLYEQAAHQCYRLTYACAAAQQAFAAFLEAVATLGSLACGKHVVSCVACLSVAVPFSRILFIVRVGSVFFTYTYTHVWDLDCWFMFACGRRMH